MWLTIVTEYVLGRAKRQSRADRIPGLVDKLLKINRIFAFRSFFTISDFVLDTFTRPLGFAAFRLTKDGLIEKLEDFIENGFSKSKYKKTGKVIV